MKFNTIAEAFNHYKNHSNEQLEKRASEINEMIERGQDIDVHALQIELSGIAEAKRNNDQKAQSPETRSQMTLIGGMDAQNKTFEADSVLDTQEYRSAFFKSLLGQEMTKTERSAFDVATQVAEKRDDAFSTSTSAVAVLPTSTLNEVIKKARTIGGLMGEVRMFNMPTKIAIPVGTPSSKANWHTEGGNVESEAVSVAKVSFDGYEIMKVFSISAKTRKMSISAFESYIIDELSACVMECIADALVNGTGSSQGKGLEALTWTANQNMIQVAKGGSIKYDDVINAIALLKRGYAQGAKFAMNNSTLYKTFYSMVDNNKRPIFIADLQNGTIGKILGFEIVVDDNIADNVVYFGNYKKYLGVNIPEGIMIETSRESSFKKGLIDYRALAIADCQPLVDEAFVKIAIATA